MTFAEERESSPVDGPDAGGTSQGEPGGDRSGTGDDAEREAPAEPDPEGSSNEGADDAAGVDEPSSKGDV